MDHVIRRQCRTLCVIGLAAVSPGLWPWAGGAHRIGGQNGCWAAPGRIRLREPANHLTMGSPIGAKRLQRVMRHLPGPAERSRLAAVKNPLLAQAGIFRYPNPLRTRGKMTCPHCQARKITASESKDIAKCWGCSAFWSLEGEAIAPNGDWGIYLIGEIASRCQDHLPNCIEARSSPRTCHQT